MIDWFLKKYFTAHIDDLPDRQIRVWQRVHSHINSSSVETQKPKVNLSLGFAWAPLLVASLLVVISTTASGFFHKPVSNNNTLMLDDDLAKHQKDTEKSHFEFIVQRAEEVISLENKAKIDGKLSSDEEEIIVRAKAEIGQRALALSKGVSQNKSQQAAITPSGDEEHSEELILVETAEVQIVGEAVLQLVKSASSSNARANSEDLTQKIKEVVKNIETTETAVVGAKNNISSIEGEGQDKELTGQADTIEKDETKNETKQNTASSLIEEEVSDGEIQIKE